MTTGTPPDGALAGRRVGRYHITREIARGGMGVVYLAWDPRLHRKVAIKVLPGGALHAGTEALARFEREARAVASLDHPGIVRVFDIGDHEDCVYFAMDLVEGGTLAERMSQPMAPVEVAELVVQLARSLAAAHAQGIVHRDMKPGNVLMELDGTPRITDFGLALQPGDLDSRLTAAGVVMGTPTYMAPEQAAGESATIGPAADVYALGVIAFELLTGQLPWDMQGAALLMAKPDLDARSPRAVRPGVPVELSTVVTKALARLPTERYPEGGALADDLERFLRGEPVQARAPSLITRLRWTVRRNRRTLPMWIGVSALLFAVLGAVWLAGADERRHALREVSAEARWSQIEANLIDLLDSGKVDEADALFASFVAMPEVQRTEALAQAWLARADRAQQVPDQIDALASAYRETRDSGRQRLILLAMAQRFRQNHQLDRVAAVLGTLSTNGLDDGPEVAALQALVDVGRLDLLAAADGWAQVEGAQGPRARAARALSDVTIVDQACEGERCIVWDSDGDGDPELMSWIDGAVLVRSLPGVNTVDRRLPAVGQLTENMRHPPDSSTRRVLLQTSDGVALVGPVDEAGLVPQPVAGLGESVWFPRLLGHHDLDHDGELEPYVAANRGLYRLDAQGDGWVATPLVSALELLNSEIMGMEIVDLDDDGRAEIVLATAEWGAYDVRVYDGSNELTLRARLRLGEVYALVVLPGEPTRVAALVRRSYTRHLQLVPNDPMFEGVAILKMEGEELRVERTIEYGTRGFGSMEGADVDGDGLVDLVLSGDGGVAVMVGERDGGFAPMLMADQLLIGVVDVDDDPADELLLWDGEARQTWIAGAGTMEPPVRAVVPSKASVAPALADPWHQAAWERAEDLVAVGLPAQAAEHLERLSSFVSDEATGASALVRALELRERAWDWQNMRSTARKLRSWPGVTDAQLLPARRALAMGLHLDDELATLDALDDLGDLADRRAELAAARHGVPLVVDFAQPLDPAWRVLAPELVQHQVRDGALSLPLAYGQPLAQLPVQIGPGPLQIDLDIELEGVEWGGRLDLTLRPLDQPDGEPFELTYVMVRGGQGLNHMGGGRLWAHLPWGSYSTPGAMDWSGTISVIADPGSGRVGVRATKVGDQSAANVEHGPGPAVEDGVVYVVHGDPNGAGLPPGAYSLVISTSGQGCAGGRFVLRRIALQGGGVTIVDVAPADSAQRAAVWVVEGQPERALQVLSQGEPSDLMASRVRLAAYDALGDEVLAKRELSGLLDDPRWDRALLKASLRHSPRTYAAWTSDLIGPTWGPVAWQAWRCSLDQKHVTQATLRSWTEDLGRLYEIEPGSDVGPGGELALAEAMLAQGRAWQARGNDARARRSLTRAQAWVDSGAGPLEQGVARRGIVGQILVERAVIAQAAGRSAEGVALLRRALVVSPTPELFSDDIAADPRLKTLVNSPDWTSGVVE